jgi:hypothetical protein
MVTFLSRTHVSVGRALYYWVFGLRTENDSAGLLKLGSDGAIDDFIANLDVHATEDTWIHGHV